MLVILRQVGKQVSRQQAFLLTSQLEIDKPIGITRIGRTFAFHVCSTHATAESSLLRGLCQFVIVWEERQRGESVNGDKASGCEMHKEFKCRWAKQHKNKLSSSISVGLNFIVPTKRIKLKKRFSGWWATGGAIDIKESRDTIRWWC